MRFVPRSAVYGQTILEEGEMPSRAQQARSMPGVVAMRPQAGNPGTNPHNPHTEIQRMQLVNGQLKTAVMKVRADRDRIVKEANAKLGALAGRVRQLEGALRTAYAPGIQIPGHGQVDVGVPTHALRNPNVYTTDGGRGAPPAQWMDPNAGNPRSDAGPPGTEAHTAMDTVQAAQEALFYGAHTDADAAFYSGGEGED